jgi:chemotaxis protein methyltransferase CheR
MIDRITTNETHFFREPGHFEYLERTLLPAWIAAAERGMRSRQLRVWSAGCASGEEPFSLAMTALAALPQAAGWSVEVYGTDVSTRMVAAARRATWSIEKARDIPARHLKRFMLQGVGAQRGQLRAGPELRRVVHLDWLNLHEAVHPRAPFDLVLCRNVLIYFGNASRQRVIERLTHTLTPGGRLFVGHAESLHRSTGLEVVAPTIYARPTGAPWARLAEEEA